MLRILITLAATFSYLSHADTQDYEDPSEAQISEARSAANSTLSQTTTLLNSDAFTDQLRSQRESISTVRPEHGNHTYDLGNISPEYKEKLSISKALAAHSPIDSNMDNPWSTAPIVLISFSMPDSQIRSLHKETSSIGGYVVLRGLIDNDINKTFQRIREIIGDGEVAGIRIDPTLFTRFDVTSVPTFILPTEPIESCTPSGCKAPKHAIANGTASLRYFLETAGRLGTQDEKRIAESWLAKY